MWRLRLNRRNEGHGVVFSQAGGVATGSLIRTLLVTGTAAACFLCGSLSGGEDQTETRLVDLNVVVTDGRGQPVPDLTGADFQITDGNKIRPIAFFRHNDNRVLKVQRSVPGEFSNRRSAFPQPTVVLFDLMNQRFGTRATSANQIIRELGSLESAEGLFLYFLTLDGRLYVVRGLTEVEPESGNSESRPWTREIKSRMDNGMRAVLRVRPIDIDVNVRVQLTFNALDELASQLSRFPGRKNLVWITDGVPIGLGPQRSDTGDYVDFTPQLRQLSESFERGGVAIYPVRQVMMGSPDAMGAGYGGSGLGSQETLDEFAGLTGGRPPGTKDIGAAVRQAMNDVRTSYQIGYLTEPRDWDSKFHKIRIKCSRKGVRVQARTGYYAWPEPPGARAERAISAAVTAAFDTGEIGIRASLHRDPADGSRRRLDVRIDAADIALAHVDNQYSGLVRIVVAGADRDGRILSSHVVPLSLTYSAEAREKILREGIEYAEALAPGDGLSQIRIVVFDHGSDSVGSLTIPVDGAGPDVGR